VSAIRGCKNSRGKSLATREILEYLFTFKPVGAPAQHTKAIATIGAGIGNQQALCFQPCPRLSESKHRFGALTRIAER